MKKTGRCKKYIFYTKKGRKKAVFIDLFYHLLYNAGCKNNFLRNGKYMRMKAKKIMAVLVIAIMLIGIVSVPVLAVN